MAFNNAHTASTRVDNSFQANSTFLIDEGNSNPFNKNTWIVDTREICHISNCIISFRNNKPVIIDMLFYQII